MKTVLTVLLALTGTAAIAASDIPLAPFQAQYMVSRNGKELGQTTLSLVDNGDGSWTLRSQTKGTKGLARLAGVDVTEQSRLRWDHGRPESLSYDYRQDTAIKQRNRHADFDWSARQVRVEEDGGSFTFPIEPGLVDRSAVTVALAADLARGKAKDAGSLAYRVAMKDRVEERRYEVLGPASIEVPAGRFDTIKIQRDVPNRVSTTWFSPSHDWIPVRIEQNDKKKNDTTVLQLVSIK